ncbi:inverse autotransporter beta domain-containing protein, partial [Escherichia coli]|nr:inverse autotransporter beta domain-containing protein [Escherichia coli]
VRKLLGDYGYAKINASTGINKNREGFSGDFFIPVYESESALLFSQIGMRKYNKRVYANYGFGVRYFPAAYITGMNLFIDQDYTGDNSRLGIGGEYFYGYFKISSNLYKAITNWHDSVDFNGDLLEKAADGIDMRIDGNLPFFPAIGLKLSAEKYYGNNVSALNIKEIRSHPFIFSTGINYTPFPLVT